MKAWKAEFALLLVTLLWGATFLFTKIGLNDCTPSTFIIIRFFIAISLTLIFYSKSIFSIRKEVLLQGLVLGLLFGSGFVLQTYGLKYTSVSKSAFITGMTVPITPFVFKLIQKSKINKWSKIGVVVSTIGLFIFTKPDFNNINLGDFVTLLSTVFWAFYITLLDKYTKGKSDKNLTSQLVAMQFVAALLPAIISFFIFDFSNFKFNLSNDLIIAIAFNAVMASFVATFVQTKFQRYTSPIKAALIFSLEPIFANIFAIIVINEILSFREYTGAAILLCGLLISEIGPLLKKFFPKIEKI